MCVYARGERRSAHTYRPMEIDGEDREWLTESGDKDGKRFYEWPKLWLPIVGRSWGGGKLASS